MRATIRRLRNGLERRTRWRERLASRLRSAGRFENPKVFCVGRNKTGTTSIAAALEALGYRVGRQRDAELLMEDWARRDFRRLVAYCHSADAFQDVPFSLDFTFQAMDAAFPGSKFVLTVRSSPEEWYESMIRFQTKRIGKGRLPTVEDLKADDYVAKGWAWRNRELIYGHREDELWDETIYKSHYVRHNERVREYFRHRPADLLVLNLAEEESMRRLCDFLGRPWSGQQMPRLNRSS